MAIASTHTPDPIMRGDTWRGLTVTGVTVNGANPPSPAASAVCEFFQTGPNVRRPVLALTATITNAATWALQIPPQVLPLNEGTWQFRVQVTRVDGQKKTYLQGVLPIH